MNRCVLAGLALVAVSCRDGGHGGGSGLLSGELGYARFDWMCTGGGDLACEPDYEDALPRTVALGSRFDMGFSLTERVPDALREGSLVLAGSTSVRETSFDYQAMESGPFTLMALTSDGEVADFARFEVRAVDTLQVVRDCDWVGEEVDVDGRPVSACGGFLEAEYPVGESLQVRAEPYGGGEPLMGALEYEWESRTPGRVRVSSRGTHEAELELRGRGEAEVVVRTGSVEQVLTLTVVGEVPIDSSGPRRTPPGDPGETDTEGETDTQGETDTEGGTDTTGGETDTDTDAGTGTTGGMQ